MNDENEEFIIAPNGTKFQVPKWLHHRVVEAEEGLAIAQQDLATMTRNRDMWRERYDLRTHELRTIQNIRRQANERKARRIARKMVEA